MIDSMLKLLNFVDAIGGNTTYRGTSNRKEFSKYVKEKYGKDAYILLQTAWKNGYIRTGNLWGFILTKRGLIEVFRLEGVEMLEQ